MALRVTPVAPVGSLLKGERERRTKTKMRQVRERDDTHLEAIRQLPCLACSVDPCGEAAHLRLGDHEAGKANPGIGRKPDDKFSLPLCHACHMEQHRGNELEFWRSRGIVDPLKIAATLYRLSPHLEPMRAAVWACHAVNALERER